MKGLSFKKFEFLLIFTTISFFYIKLHFDRILLNIFVKV